MDFIHLLIISFLFYYILFNNNFILEPYEYIQHETKDVLYVNLMGGLGNRLFQIASGYGVAKQNNMILKIKDDLGNSHNIQHEWIIDNLNNLFKHIQPKHTTDIQDYITHHEQQEHTYYDIVIDKNNNKPTVLFGYFQSEDFFKHCREDILQLFQEPSHISQQLNKFTNFDNLIAIHVRLGDFLSYDIHNINLTEYYNTAIRLAKEYTHPDIEFIIISEDTPDIIKKHYPLLQYYPLLQEKNSPEYDMFFMSRCRGVICPNSTFSWWGAWLNKRTDKFITLPNRFLNSRSSSLPMDKAIIIDI